MTGACTNEINGSFPFMSYLNFVSHFSIK